MVFGKKKEAHTEVVNNSAPDANINVYLGAGTSFEGKLEYSGTAQVSGAFKGEIVSQGALSIGRGGSVQGELQVGQLSVTGQFQGAATCSRKAVLLRDAKFDGDLTTPKLEVEAGADFEGNISMPQS